MTDPGPTVPTHEAPSVPKKAWRSPAAWALFLVLTSLFLAADLVSKDIAFERIDSAPVVLEREAVEYYLDTNPQNLQAYIPPHEPVVVVPGLLEFKLVLNPGAVFGTGPGKRWFFIGFTIVALVIASVLFAVATHARMFVTHTGIALIVSGGLGNLYDRVVYACVRDFIHPLPGVTWPGSTREVWPYVSNVADAFLLIGIAIVMVRLWKSEQAAKRDELESDSPDEAADQTGSGDK